jgi:hypothetical protein
MVVMIGMISRIAIDDVGGLKLGTLISITYRSTGVRHNQEV